MEPQTATWSWRTGVAGAGSTDDMRLVRLLKRNAAEGWIKMRRNYLALATEGARSVDQRQTVERLREIIVPIMAPRKTRTTVLDEGDVVISRELAKEILTALDNGTRFGAHVGAIVQRADVAEWGDSVRTESREAAQSLRRVAMAQESAA